MISFPSGGSGTTINNTNLTGNVSPRQTVLQASTDSFGMPNFLEASGTQLQLKAALSKLIMSFAGGFGANGAIDYINEINADSTILSGLSASKTYYLYADRDTSENITWGVSEFPYIASKIEPITDITSLAVALNSTNAGITTALAGLRDGNLTTTGAYSNIENDWSIGYDFGNNVEVTKIRFHSKSGTEMVRHFLVEKWDGAAWVKCPIIAVAEGASITNSDEADASNIDGWSTITITPTQATKFRIRFTSCWNVGDVNAWVSELYMFSLAQTDQHWFDLNKFKMRRQTGTAWEDKTRLFVGEFSTDASSNIINVKPYAVNGRYEAKSIGTTNGVTMSKNHNLGCTPVIAARYENGIQQMSGFTADKNSISWTGNGTNTDLVVSRSFDWRYA